MNPFVESPSRLPWPPIIYAGCLLGSAMLQNILPVARVDTWLEAIPLLSGLVILGAGLAIDVLAVRELWRSQTTMLPTAPAKNLVTSGVYRYTRNPIYLGNALVLLGVAIACHWTWLIALLPFALRAVHCKAVLKEERHLAILFKKQWHDYARATPRWL